MCLCVWVGERVGEFITPLKQINNFIPQYLTLMISQLRQRNMFIILPWFWEQQLLFPGVTLHRPHTYIVAALFVMCKLNL